MGRWYVICWEQLALNRKKKQPIHLSWFSHPGTNYCSSLLYRVFSLTWPASMQIYWNKRKRLHKKRVQLPQDWFGTPTWPPWRHVKTLYCLGEQPTFSDANSGFTAKWRLRNERRNSILMTCYHSDLGSASDWLKQITVAARPIRSATQMSVSSHPPSSG